MINHKCALQPGVLNRNETLKVAFQRLQAPLAGKEDHDYYGQEDSDFSIRQGRISSNSK